ncbi:DUF6603 domain-containing protein [Herbidospora daliensis]|uniref:DUF6603 domain-containing protein n=1 Tax=Herbidospora daliensis TaxID=295585 RepID=UPI00078656D7|nr:DUF6603 domain-containing protein [Herbidospora daliensis]
MTPEELDSLIPYGGRLDLAVSALGSPDLTALFGRFLPDGRLVVDIDRRRGDGDGVTVTGTGVTGPFTGMEVTAEFGVSGQVATLRLEGVGDRSWRFGTAFPSLARTYFDDLVIDRPAFVLDWGPDVVASAPDPGDVLMSFTGTLETGTATALLDLLMPNVGAHTLEGSIDTTSLPALRSSPAQTVPIIVISGPDDGEIQLGSMFSVSSLRYQLTAMPTFNYEMAALVVICEIVFEGLVSPANGDAFGDVLITARTRDLGSGLTLSAQFKGPDDDDRPPGDGDRGLPLSLNTIRSIMQRPSLTVPVDLGKDLTVRLTGLTTRVTTSPSLGLDFVSFALQSDVDWPIVPDLLTLQAIDLNVGLAGIMTGPTVSGAVSGLLGIGDSGTLELTADLSGALLSGGLRDGDPPLKIAEVYEHFTGDSGDLPDLTVPKFNLQVVTPGSGRALAYHGVVELRDLWQIGPVALTDVWFTIDRDASGTAFVAKATFVVHTIAILVSASYDSATGWVFSGESGYGQRVAVGELVESVARDLGGPPTLPKPVEDLVVQNLAASFSTGSDQLIVTAEASFPVDTIEVDIAVAIDTGAHSYGGSLTAIAGDDAYEFDVHFLEDHGVDLLTASYVHTSGPLPDLRTLISGLSPSAARFIPAGISVDVADVVFAMGSAYVFSVDLKATIDLSGLPLVGPHLTGDRKMGFDPLRIVAATGAMPSADIASLNGILPQGVHPFPPRDMAAGFALDGTLLLGPLENPVALPVSDGEPAPVLPNPPPAQSPGGQNAVWYAVQRGLGPVHVERVGLAYAHDAGKPPVVGVLVDGSISVGGLSLSLDGLQASVPLTLPVQAPSFDLKGLGVAYTEGPVSVSGAFLKGTLVYDDVTYPAYSGRAVIATEDLTLGAIGSYAQLPSGPSLFVYAVLDHAFGGPPFFFVTGLAAGFGYNRRLTLPDVTGIATFPLVQEALGTRPPGTLAAEMKALEPYITPSEGDGFVVAGIRFSTFKMIDSFLLAAVSFGGRFEVDVLGLSTLVLPVADTTRADTTPIAELQLALKATFAPSDGYFSLIAQLTPNSFLLSRACHLTGGLAFTSWFGGPHDGDFVLTVGGYHPAYGRPAHYPLVPRVGFTWQVDDHLSIRGGAYYALTPSALMAGGAISIDYHDGNLRAWFDASMDFLIAWQPYHYDARFRINVGASYTYKFFGTHTVNAHVDADVHLWGPEFAGTAKVDIKVISFTIPFGASNPKTDTTIPWAQFKTTLLPADKLSIAVRAGATGPGSGADLGVVDPATLELTTDCVVPSTVAKANATVVPTTGGAFGVAPSGIRTGITSTHRVRISRDGFSAESDFVFTPITKALPSALWGTDPAVSVHRPELTAPLVTGFHIAPKPHQNGASVTLAGSVLAAGEATYTESTLTWQDADTALVMSRAGKLGQAIVDPAVAATRRSVAAAVLTDPEIDFTGFDFASYAEIPFLDYHE